MSIRYQRDAAAIDWTALASLIAAAGLGHANPADVQRAYTNSALVVFAFDQHSLVGAAAAISDGVYHAQICVMVVAPSHQRQGIGSTMLRMLLDDLAGIKVLLTASFGKEDFYRKHGFRRHKTALATHYGPWWYAEE